MALELEVETYAGFEAVLPSCLICQYCVKDTDEKTNLYFCTNPDTEAYLLGGMTPPIKKPAEWHCPLWQVKAEG